MKRPAKKKTPRIPLEALKRLGSHAQTGKKGKKGYLRTGLKKETRETSEEESP